MSALTDLFTALANKIRSKTGGSDTYTPPEMVAAIDDVYDAGVAAGTTPTQTKTVTAGTSTTTVTPDQGYALSSVTVNPTPSQSKSASPSTSAQTISPDAGKLLSSVSISAIQTQTKSSAPNVSTNKDVTPDSGKYLSKVTITPLSHTGTYIPAANTAANDMGEYHDKRYVDTSGMYVPSGTYSAGTYTTNGTKTITGLSAYASVQFTINVSGSVKTSTSTLWTNSAPTSDFSAQTVTLSSSMQNYDYLIITFKASATGTSTWKEYVKVSEFVDSYYQSGGSATTGAMASGTFYNGSGSTVYTYNRPFTRKSNTQITFSNCRRSTTSSAANYTNFVIPTKIEGMYYYV